MLSAFRFGTVLPYCLDVGMRELKTFRLDNLILNCFDIKIARGDSATLLWCETLLGVLHPALWPPTQTSPLIL